MNDIGLLIASALTTGHPSVPYLFNETAVELNLSVKESNLIQSTGNRTTARITPPEFIGADGIQIASTVFSKKSEDVLKKIRNRIDSLDCCRLASKVISATKEPIILDTSLDDSVSTRGKIILPSTSPPSLTDAIENTPYVTPQLQETFAGSPNSRRVNSGTFFASYDQRLPNLSFGSSGLSVRILQRLLIANNYPVQVDGNFGAFTEIAVRAFQSNRNLTVDGVVGQQTWQQLSR